MTNDNLNNTVLFANDGSESLSQFVGDRIIGQLANNLGNMALAFPSVANSVLFANGATTASTAAAQQLTQMTASALGLTAFTLGNELQLLPGGTTLIPALQNAIFGTVNGITGTTSGTTTGTTGTSSTTSTSLFNALQALPTTSTAFASAFPGVFSTALTNVTSILSPFVGTFPTPTFALNTNPVTGALSPTFTANTFKSGFLGGFGTGATGFGVAPAAANTDFGPALTTSCPRRTRPWDSSPRPSRQAPESSARLASPPGPATQARGRLARLVRGQLVRGRLVRGRLAPGRLELARPEPVPRGRVERQAKGGGRRIP